jgi:putative endonuclease
MKTLGNDGEIAAATFLRGKGYCILHRNYRTPVGEADIIAEDKGITVFVEVKTRSSEAFGSPFEAVDRRKQEKLKRIALYYLKGRKEELPVRFDVISIMFKDGRHEVTHIKEAF